jgi:hypothetical protein
MNAYDELAAAVYELEQQLKTLGSASQLSSSTVGDDGNSAAPGVGEIIADAAITNDAVPDLQDDSADADEATSDLTGMLQGTDDDLDARFADVDITLANKAEELAEAADQ